MTVKTTLSFTDRHHGFLAKKVGEGAFATQSAVVAAAVEQMMQDEIGRDLALRAMAEEIRRRLAASPENDTDADTAFAKARSRIAAARGE